MSQYDLLAPRYELFGSENALKRAYSFEYGDITRGPALIDDNVKTKMKGLLEDVRNGKFAQEWILENQANRPVLSALRKRESEHPIEKVGKQLRSMMSWIDAREDG